jgi:hypothetical protein
MDMTVLTEQEATFLLHSYGIKWDRAMVKQWISEGIINGINNSGLYPVTEGEAILGRKSPNENQKVQLAEKLIR